MNTSDIIKSKRLFIISGSSGTGKTVFIANLKRMMDGTEVVRVYDDMSYVLESSNTSGSRLKRQILLFKDIINTIRHTDDRVVIVVHGITSLPVQLRNLLHDEDIKKNTAIILTSISVEQFNKLKWFKRETHTILKEFIQVYSDATWGRLKKQKTKKIDIGSRSVTRVIDLNRPFLLMTQNANRIGWFDMIKEGWEPDLEALINPGWELVQ